MLALALALTFIVPSPLAVSPAKAELFEFGMKDEKKLGEKFNVLVRSKLSMIEDSEVVDYVDDMVQRLGRVPPLPPFKLQVAVVRDNTINAFAAPAGYVFVFSGLILNMSHESEVAGVLAHEISHESQRHIAKRMEQGTYMSIAAMLGTLAGMVLGATTKNGAAGAVVATGSQALATQSMLNYSREDEREADEVGMNRLVEAGYSPKGLPDSFAVLRRLQVLQGSAGAGGIPAYLSTHPGIAERIDYLNERVRRMAPDIVNRPEHDERFLRVQTIIRSLYSDPKAAIAWYLKKGQAMTKIDHLGLAIALGRTTNNDGARQAFDIALKESGNDALCLREAGAFYLRMRDFDKARALLGAAVAANPRDMTASAGYAQILGQDGRNAEALALFRRVIANMPASVAAHQMVGRVYGQTGDMFHAYLNLAYAAVYSNNPGQSKMNIDKTKGYAKTDDDRRELATLEQVFKDRSQYWPKPGVF